MAVPMGNQENRVYTDYGEHKSCQGCEVFNYMVCPLVEHAYLRGRKMKHCLLLRPFAERLIRNMRAERKRA